MARTAAPKYMADPVAAAFAHTFWWSVAAILIAFVPTLFLPNHAPQAAGDASSPGAAQDNEAGGPPVARAALD